MEKNSSPLALSLPTEGFLPFVKDAATPSAWNLAQLRHSMECEGLCGGHKGHF